MEITKFQAAEFQLITAIDLYFKDKDPVSVHTLVRSAHEIFNCLCEHSGLERSVVEQSAAEFVKPELKKDFFKKINEARNFFKHAENDPEATLSWNPYLSTFFIWDATCLYRRLCPGEMPCEILIFSAFFRVQHSELWKDKSPLDCEIPGAKEELKNISKRDAYDILLSQCKHGGKALPNLTFLL
jgi:hypothetical protein